MARNGNSTDSEVRSTGVFTPTRVLAGKYHLGRMVGEGGMGAVYEAEHEGLGARVAVKLLSEAGTTDPKSLARFRREAKAMGAIRHENVVTVMDTGTDDTGVPFLVMELLEGESLAGMLRRERVLDPGLACWIVSQILSGLTAAHAVDVVHRDLKPGNIFVARRDDGSHRVKILDFGISKLGDASATMNVTADGALVGTPNFMAPEQIRANVPIDGRVDLYATGIILYRMVCGRLPYVGTTSEELYRRILEARPTPPRQHRPEIPPQLEAVILKAMHPDRDQRFPTAGSFAAALREMMPTQPLAALPPTPHPSMPITRPPPTEDIPQPAYPAAVDSYAAPATVAARPSSKRPPGASEAREPRRWPLLLALVIAVGGLVGAAITYLGTRDGGRGADEATAGAVVTEGVPLRFGIIRHKSPQEIGREMRPLTDYLAERIGRTVQLVIVDNYEDLAEELLAGEVDVGALSAYSYVRAKRRDGGLRLLGTPVTQAGATYEGYILARAGAGIDELADFEGKVFCYVSENSTSGYLYPRALFRRAGMDPDSAFKATRFTTDHAASIRALDNGACDGAAVYAAAWHDARQQDIDPARFSMVAKTERIPWDAYAVTDGLDAQTADALAAALRGLEPGSETARTVLVETGAPFVGFQVGDDSLYDSVRRIEKYLAQEPRMAPLED